MKVFDRPGPVNTDEVFKGTGAYIDEDRRNL
jgi:hypothetical protein